MMMRLKVSVVLRFTRGLVGCSAIGLGLAIVGFSPPAEAAVCDGTKIPCVIGDTGPGGGIVFYDAGKRQAWGRYLEAAPANWAGPGGNASVATWCAPPADGRRVTTKGAIGTGLENSRAILGVCGKSSAAGRAMGYFGGGMTDWFLPSREEALEMVRMGKLYNAATGLYWTSSQELCSLSLANVVGGTPIGSGCNGKSTRNLVRPVRAF